MCSVVKDAQTSDAGYSNEEVSQAYPPTYGNHGKNERLEGKSNGSYTDYTSLYIVQSGLRKQDNHSFILNPLENTSYVVEDGYY
ncbi:4149_t:CDS:2 [Funneliformis mosseae]|uniref:4149_t:CDS:1 n=1 Tax=Funneliformis mosseae TaxID=27381 RepID=A0A9N8V3C5_FUNMO|nr:4149_t:CDS:2 [Funneliformis mosseae]